MYTAQNGYEKGFAGTVPGILFALSMLIVGWTGFCIKPLRDSGAMTIPELFDRQFGPRIRWLSGVVIVLRRCGYTQACLEHVGNAGKQPHAQGKFCV